MHSLQLYMTLRFPRASGDAISFLLKYLRKIKPPPPAPFQLTLNELCCGPSSGISLLFLSLLTRFSYSNFFPKYWMQV